MKKKLGMVIAPHPDATNAGIDILKNGGNAFDAAIAAGFAVCVVDPANTSIGGYGGSLVAYSHDNDAYTSINFDSRAPAGARDDMFELVHQPDGGTTVQNDANLFGPKSIGVPGNLRGMELALKKYGTKSISQVIAPAIKLATKGFTVNKNTNTSIAEVASNLASEQFRPTAKLMMPKGRVPRKGETLAFPELANSLSVIAEEGIDTFYDGLLSKKMIEYLESCGGLLVSEDMKQYKPIESKPLKVSYRDYEILTPPLCSGGLTSLQILKIVENLSIAKENKQGRAEFFHYLAEIMKLSWKERLTKYGDPEFTSLDQQAQLSRKTIQKLSDTVKQSADNPTNDKTIASARPSSTSHICAADDKGNFVSMTHTLGGSLGSLMTVPGTGIVLGHGLSRFDPNPGLPNSIGPRKQPLHNMCPMLMTRNQRMVAAFGAPGGRMIVNNMVQLVVNMVDYRKLPAAALSLPRCHVESTEPLQLERSAGKSTLDKIRKLGHKVVTVERLASPAHIIMKRSTRLVGATDPRGEGKIARL